jgi:hypothetical protein
MPQHIIELSILEKTIIEPKNFPSNKDYPNNLFTYHIQKTKR